MNNKTINKNGKRTTKQSKIGSRVRQTKNIR